MTVQYNPSIIYAGGKKIYQYAWVSASSSASAPHGAGKTVVYAATLDTGQEVPPPKGTKLGAHGRFSATLSGTTLTWTLTFSGLTGAATAAHIHKGAKGKSGSVLVALCGPCRSPAKGTAKLTAAQIKLLEKAGTYANVHTAKNPNGEIRGQIALGTSSSPSAAAKTTTTGKTTTTTAAASTVPGTRWDTDANEAGLRGKNGQRFKWSCPPNGPIDFVHTWGTDVYDDGSAVCIAAVHAGVITLAAGGTIVIEIRPGESSYTGSTRNGITTFSYGATSGSFVIVGKG